jgi:hexosaminidase
MLQSHPQTQTAFPWTKPMRMLALLILASVLCLAIDSMAPAPVPMQLGLMPLPSSIQFQSGQLGIDPSFSVAVTGYTDARLERAVERFLNRLRLRTGMLPLDMSVAPSTTASLTVEAQGGTPDRPQLGEDESYTLEVMSSGAKLSAPTPSGIIHGLQTFLQLVGSSSAGFVVPAVSIQDQPRFPWRGLLIDACRHFVPRDVLKRNLDGMEAVKLNVLHWHLSDNQGFRVESKKFPKLQELGSDGLFYTDDEIRDLIAYAGDRGIRVVPEFDMPGHSTAWFVGYPELASGPGPYHIERRWGVFDPAMDPTQEKTYKFLDDFVGEMARLFPDQYFHIGGDEVNGKQWDANVKIQEFKRAHRLRDNLDLQAYFNSRVERIVSKHGKTMMGWDEILHPDLPKTVVVQTWRGQEALAKSARQGVHGIFSNGYYLDLMWPAAQHYAVDPLANASASLSPEEKKLVLGAEACMWSEYISPENIDSRIWPRLAALAERFWSRQEVRDADSMYARLEQVSHSLDELGLTHNSGYAPMLRRIAGLEDISAVHTLADVVEPVKDYNRYALAASEPTSTTPLNRLVDAARPESVAARQFHQLVDELLAGAAKPGTEEQIKTLLVGWYKQRIELQPMAEKSFLLKEVVPLSQDLSALAVAGLEALEYLDRGQRAPAAWKAQKLALVEEAKKPRAQLLLMVASPVGKLVEASGDGATPGK